MKMYRLDIQFYSPCVFYDPPILDSIIAYCLERENNDRLAFFAGRSSTREFIGVKKLPELIEFYQDIPLTTQLQFKSDAPIWMDSWKTRFDFRHHRYMEKKSSNIINASSGKYRSFNVPLQARLIQSGYFVFIGEGLQVYELLKKWIFAIGKKPSEGFGVIDKMSLMRFTGFKETFILERRPIPSRIAKDLDIGGFERMAAWKPPYWRKENHVLCITPEL